MHMHIPAPWSKSLSLATFVLSFNLAAASAVAAATPQPASCQNTGPNGAIVLHFDRAQQADQIALDVAYAPTGTVLRVSDGTHSVRLPVDSHTDGRSEAMLRSPLAGTTFTVSVDAQNLADDAVCVSAVALFDGGRRLEPQAAAGATALDGIAPLVGVWHGAAPGGPLSTLTFAADGTWQWQAESGATSQQRAGTYRYVDGRLEMRLGHAGAYVDMHLLRQDVPSSPAEEAQAAGYAVVMLGSGLDAQIAGTYRDPAGR
jgi:hypothetical protein